MKSIPQIIEELNLPSDAFLKDEAGTCEALVKAGMKEEAVSFVEWYAELIDEEGETYVNRNPFGVKPGYYTKKQLYKIYCKQK